MTRLGKTVGGLLGGLLMMNGSRLEGFAEYGRGRHCPWAMILQ